MRRFILVLVLIAISFNSLAAQGVASDSGATRVRVRLAGTRQATIGIITRLDGDTIHLRAVEGDMAIARADLTKLEVSRGMHSNAGRGFRKGMWIGGIVGAVAGTAILSDPDEYWYDGGAEILPLAIASVGLEGAIIGAGIGALSHSERWQKSGTDSQTLSLYVAPHEGRTVVGLGVRF